MSQAFHVNSESPSAWLKNTLFVEVGSNKPVGKLSLCDHFLGVQPEMAVAQ
jgi:hypothetical protein